MSDILDDLKMMADHCDQENGDEPCDLGMLLVRAIGEIRKLRGQSVGEVSMPEPVAYLYTLEYGSTIANTKVSLWQLNYPFGSCGADYLPQNEDGISYVRQTPLYTAALADDGRGFTEGLGAASEARWPRTAEHTLRMFRRTQLELGVPTAKLMPEDPADAVAWLALHADLGNGPCIHGVRAPHECKECAEEPSEAEVAAIDAALRKGA
jgi:hypothetical protein